MTHLRTTTLLAALLATTTPLAAQVSEPQYALEEVSDGLWRYVAGNYVSMVWVTDDGIAVLDTLNDDAARWLSDELKKRFEQPIRYVIYSHSHYDHVYGGEVFDQPGVTFVAQEQAYQDLQRSKANAVLPDLTFEDTLRLRLGNETLVLRHHGPNNGRGSVSMQFERADVMYVVDWIVLGRMPYQNLKGYDIHGMISSTRDVLDLDWETFVGGHADTGDRTDVERYLSYLETLYNGVLQGMLDGKSLETIQSDLMLEEFSDLAKFEEWRAQNIAGVYETLDDTSYVLMRPEVSNPQDDSGN
ncbi:MBL fold metallo-hydrolase [Notoacmeibacter sp. MSK16QG-6]|uniref:MBL fold metallo-hydrolase n=1 Tax=Notoacmeibacter sp. MSK16QG-6 TaxID=2957982 RepID=UPI00209E6C9A|nr:MBL fold metallo-hydrolase [Notoacmeibacter sp. MSK16QG-6]MCP1199090.1 MBL fold metallo-hydrolase [Notoacmeibacter sp. MSK16QG-6]